MNTSVRITLIFLLACLSACQQQDTSTQTPPAPEPQAIAMDANDISGVVTSDNGPEAGVWVIAETDEFATRFARIVVTDEDGRYLVPDLPDAAYQVWVRGYGLADSIKIAVRPGQRLDLTANVEQDPAAAATIYPAAYWYAMMHMPEANEVATIPGGLNAYLMWMKNMGCVGCHQLGNLATRTLPEGLGEFADSKAAWARRISSGQAGAGMIGQVTGLLQGVPLKYLADWTDRIAAGELPVAKPERPSGLERNVVATVRDWSTPKAYMHDLSSTDRRNPTVNAYGKLYGAPELSTDEFPILDPVKNTATVFSAPVRDPETPSTGETPANSPSPYWGDERIWNSKANAHNPMLDADGKVWYTARVRGPENPAFCRAGSDHPSAKAFPLERSDRQLALLDPETSKYTFIDTCYGTHHLQFATDADDTLWTSGGGNVVGWLNTRVFLETGDAAKAQGWTPLVLDHNGNGRRDAYVEPDQTPTEAQDQRINAGFYAVMPNPADGSVWGSAAFRYPGAILRLDPGTNPPETALTEIYNVPLPGFGVRGADIDTNGVVWVSLGSGHLGEFDRRKCQGPLNGPAATGDHCPEGWTFHRLPGPGFAGLEDFSVESSYYTWVDQHDTAGLGGNTPIATGNLFDGVHALVDGGFVTLRIPYPLGFYAKGLEGRIDDPAAGWKGRGLWITSGDRTPWLKEGGQGTKPLVVHFQVRPDPLAN
ncbi:MAG: carboxypeptidase regulatory-like domain-containing protein [Gammaproteobacteria bacterium]|nr:MAG: carboxypeptidase regulatory-like domain-containing protein [Gammaproteobacteria bacterium]